MRGLLLVFVVTFLCGCQPRIEQCWAPETKANINDLLRKQAIDLIETGANADNKTSQRLTVNENALTVNADTFMFKEHSNEGQSIACEASVSLTLTGTDNRKFSSPHGTVTYKIYKGENGPVYAIDNVLQVKNLVEQLK